MGIVMTAHGVGMIVTKDFSFKGWPIPSWAAYAYAVVGISIIPLAWFLRRPTKHDEGKVDEKEEMRIKPAELVMGIILVSMGVMGMSEKELFHSDVPIPYPEVFSAACLVAEIVWLVVPWFLHDEILLLSDSRFRRRTHIVGGPISREQVTKTPGTHTSPDQNGGISNCSSSYLE